MEMSNVGGRGLGSVSCVEEWRHNEQRKAPQHRSVWWVGKSKILAAPQKKPSQLKYFVFDISRYAFIESPTSRFFLLPFIDLMLDL